MKGKSTFYLDDYIADIIRYYGGSRFLEGAVLLACLGNFQDAANQVSASWNQKNCPDPDNYQLYPANPEAWQAGVAGLKKRTEDESEEHASNILKHVNPNLSDEENRQAIAHYLKIWML